MFIYHIHLTNSQQGKARTYHAQQPAKSICQCPTTDCSCMYDGYYTTLRIELLPCTAAHNQMNCLHFQSMMMSSKETSSYWIAAATVGENIQGDAIITYMYAIHAYDTCMLAANECSPTWCMHAHSGFCQARVKRSPTAGDNGMYNDIM